MFKGLGKLLNLGGGDNSYYLLMGEISDESVHSCIEWIMGMNMMPADQRPSHLTLMICSPGGDLHAAFALIDVMRGSPIPIATVGLGGIASAGVLIMMAGEKGKRVLTPNTSVMSHQFFGGSLGKQHELVSIMREFELADERILKHYIKFTGLKEKEIRDKLLPKSDVWMSATEAVNYGIADIVKELK
jgi:ATP-dependent Clp protease protease subunit